LSVSSVVFSPDGKLALSGSADTTLIIWNVDNGTIVSRLEGHEDVVENAVFSPDGKTVLSAADDSLVIQWDVATGKEIKRFEGHTDWVANIIVSPDGKLAFSGSGSPEADKGVIVWDVATGKEVRRLEGHTDTVSGLAITKDGKTLITGSWDNSVGVWDAATGKEVLRITGHKDKVWNVALSPDGKTVMSASLDHTLRLWDLATGNELRRFVGHTGGVTSVAMSPDGKTALSGGEDRTVRLWDVATGREIRRFEGHTAKIWSVVYSPDGQIALSASEDKTVRQWRISRSLDELRTWIGVNRFVRTLTCEERETYRLDNPTSHPCAANAVAMVSIPASALTSTPIRGRAVQIGLNRGRIDIGGAETWTYSAQAGEAIMISVKADKAANETTDRERRERGLLDVRVIVRDAAGNVIAEGDDTVTETFRTTDAMLERLEFSTAGVYEIEVRSFGNEMGGGYTLLIGSAPEPTATPAP
jgi:WD40 repeat protein